MKSHGTTRRILVFLCGFLFAGLVHADPIDSVVKCDINYGRVGNKLSGVVVRIDGNRVYVLTNAHGFRDGPNPVSITVYPERYPPINCDQINYIGNADDKGDDLALISGQTASPPPAIELSDRSPSPGDSVALVGYPHGGSLDIRQARRTNLQSTGGDHFDRPSVEGMSGGPVYMSGRLCSLIWGGGTEGKDCYAVSLPRIRALLQRVFGGRSSLATDKYMQPPGLCGPCNGSACDLEPVPQPSLPFRPNIPEGLSGPIASDGWQPSQTPRVYNPRPMPITPISPITQVVEPVDRVELPDSIAAIAQPPAAPAETEASSNIDWMDWAAKGVVIASGIVGLGVPTWLVIAWRGARAVHRMREHIGRPRSVDHNGFLDGISFRGNALQPIRFAA